MSDTIAAVATGNIVSAIGIVRLSGPEAIPSVSRLFRPYGASSMGGAEDRKLYYGKLFTTQNQLLDVCLCTVSHGPESYTGEDTAELQCHGSPVVLRTILEELFKCGVRQAGPGEFTKRAFLNGKLDLTSAEAVIDLIDAESKESALNAAGQLTGAVYRRADEVYNILKEISAHFHAVLDYPDEDIEAFEIENYRAAINECVRNLSRLHKSYERGKLMREGIPTAIIGLPNAGKSSLLNALLGYDRAIVSDVPGTTRDTIEEKVHIGKNILRLNDTAGIHETTDYVETLGVKRSLEAVKQAELVLLVIDGAKEYDNANDRLLEYARNASNAIAVFSKKDLNSQCVPENIGIPAVNVSSVSGDGIEELEAMIEALYPGYRAPAGEIITNARHAEAIKLALEYLHSAETALESAATPDIVLTETEGAMNAIGSLTGRNLRSDITNNIFSRFCVGK